MNRINTWLSHGQITQWSMYVILSVAEGNDKKSTTFLDVPPNRFGYRGDDNERTNERERTSTPPPATLCATGKGGGRSGATVQSAMSSIIGQKAKGLTSSQDFHTPSTDETFDAFARRVRCWTCCVKAGERYWLKVRGTCEEYHDKGFSKHTLYVLHRKHLEFYNHLAEEVGRDSATQP